MSAKPPLSFWQIWNMCFGFLGIQFGFALQNANVSRIFQTLGAEVDQIPSLWIAAPLTGLLVQPVIGYYSDRTWTRLGRRRPYFLVGAIMASLALLVMPNSPSLWIAAGMLWVMDASFNVSMEPFRAFVGDQLPSRQRALGYLMQSFFIGVGSVIASALPWLLSRWGVANTAPAGVVPDAVKLAFYAGGAVMLAAIVWTVIRTREYPPEQLEKFEDALITSDAAPDRQRAVHSAVGWIVAGLLVFSLVWGVRSHGGEPFEIRLLIFTIGWQQELSKELYLFAGGLVAFGLAMAYLGAFGRRGMLGAIMADMQQMPLAMRQLAQVQFFSWVALFAMWIYTTPAVTAVHFGSEDPTSQAYNDGADWVGVLFGTYNGFAALAAIVIPLIVRRLGLRLSHVLNLLLGAFGLGSFLIISDPDWLLLSMLGVGFAWASILSLPYAMLADALPARKMGLYMGIFNFFIVIPQLVAATLLGFVLKALFAGAPIYALAIGAGSWVLAAVSTLRVTQTAPASVGAAALGGVRT